MSDGPHKSLGMRPGWKKFAKRADKAAYEPDQVADALPDALEEDWRAERCNEFAQEIRDVLGDGRQIQLFTQEVEGKLDDLKKVTGAGYPLRRMLLEAVQQSIESGKPTDPLLEGTVNALHNLTARGIRQVEEHYQRESTNKRADKVRSRMESGAGQTSLESVARRLLKIDGGSSPPSANKHNDLDDGVRI